LLKLPALGEGSYDTALMIYGIICDNSYGSGWLARSGRGNYVCDPGAPLKAGEIYYFAAVTKPVNYFF
jgi:hypothetical protein